MGLEVQWWLGDWLQALPPEAAPFDLIVSNPPYIDAEDPHLAALHAEPREALSPGPDGLAALAHIARTAPAHTAPGGALLLEHGYTQGPAVRALLQQCGWQGVMTRPDLAGVERCTGGQRAAAPPG